MTSKGETMTSKEEPKTLTYHSKLVGVTFEGRQEVIASLRGKEPLRVRREADNKYDPKAVAVDAYKEDKWVPIGYIAKDKNSEISAALDAGETAFISISDITGGGDKSYGVNISLEYKTAPQEESKVDEPTVTKKEAVRVLEHLIGLMGGNNKVVAQVETVHSVLLDKSIEVNVVGGHKRLEGYISGSQFPSKYFVPFDSDMILDKIVTKYGVDKDAVRAMWDINRDTSTDYGHAVHSALENYEKNKVLGDKLKEVKEYKKKANVIGPNKALSKNPFLKWIVESFIKQFGDEEGILTEEFIWDTKTGTCGSLDSVKIIDADKKILRIRDYKTDSNINETRYQTQDSPFRDIVDNTLLGYHWLQLSFYAYILQQAGWTVEGLDIFWLNPNKLIKGEDAWEQFTHEVIDISKELK